MKVAYVTMQFPVPSETFASLDVKALQNLGSTVDIYAMRPKHNDFDKLIAQRNHGDNRIYHLSMRNFLIGIGSMFLHPLGFLDLVIKIFYYHVSSPRHILKSIVLIPSAFYIFQRIVNSNPDIIHLFWGHYPSLCIVLLKRYRKNKLFTMFLGAHDLEENYALSSFAIRESSKIFTHSKANLEKIIEMGATKEKTEVIYRGTSVDKSQTYRGKVLTRGAVRLLTAARLIKEKGVDEVLLITKDLIEKGVNVSLTVAGDGPHRSALEKQSKDLGISHVVIFKGHISQTKLFECIQNADFFILMSRYPSERLPNVIKEAMLRGTVPITTPTQGIDELIENELDGWIVNDTHECSRLISLMLENPIIYQKVSQNGVFKILKQFNVNESMKNYRYWWEDILGNNISN